MQKIDFIGIEVDEISPYLKYPNGLGIDSANASAKDGLVYIELLLSGTASLSTVIGSKPAFFDGVKFSGKAYLRVFDATLETLPLNEATGAAIATTINLEDLALPNLGENNEPFWKNLFRKVKKPNPETKKEVFYEPTFRRNPDNKHTIEIFIPNTDKATLAVIIGKKIDFYLYTEETESTFSLLGETFDKEHFPKIYNIFKHDPGLAAEQIVSVAKAWHEGRISPAAVALESDLEHG